MRIEFSEAAQQSGDAEETILLKLAGFAFTFTLDDGSQIEGVIDPDGARGRFGHVIALRQWSEESGEWNGPHVFVNVDAIETVTYL